MWKAAAGTIMHLKNHKQPMQRPTLNSILHRTGSSLQLDNNFNGRSPVYELFNNNDKTTISRPLGHILINDDGNQISVNDFQLTPESSMEQAHTRVKHIQQNGSWPLPNRRSILIYTQLNPIRNLMHQPLFGQAVCRLEGKVGGKKVHGLGYVEVMN